MSARRVRADGRSSRLADLVVVVGSGGVGKTTVASALALGSAAAGGDTLVMTFDPSHRLKDALGLERVSDDEIHPVEAETAARLDASLLDARSTFDRLVERYTPDRTARDRILNNRFYRQLGGSLAGVLEYMAVERLFEVRRDPRYRRIILDTPPIRHALDFLEAPQRIVRFVESGVRRLATTEVFDERGRLRFGGPLRGRLERLVDELVGVPLLREMIEFFVAFDPLYDGFRERAEEVDRLLRSERTEFVLVAGPGEERVADVLFFARRLVERGYRLGPVLVNRVHPPVAGAGNAPPGSDLALARWLGERDRRGVEKLGALLGEHPVAVVPLQRNEPAEIESLTELALVLEAELGVLAPG